MYITRQLFDSYLACSFTVSAKATTHEPIFCWEAPDIFTPIVCRETLAAHTYRFFAVAGMAAKHDLVPSLLSLSLCLDIAFLEKVCEDKNYYDS